MIDSLPERERLRTELRDLLEDPSRTTDGLALARLLHAWSFVRTVPPPGMIWARGHSYWVHSGLPGLQLPIPTPDLVHPKAAQDVLSFVNAAKVHERGIVAPPSEEEV